MDFGPDYEQCPACGLHYHPYLSASWDCANGRDHQPRFTIDNDPTELTYTVIGKDREVRRTLRGMTVFETRTVGGGAFAQFTITRVR
jgi:hypothetical protein